jgi:hypothetical protein
VTDKPTSDINFGAPAIVRNWPSLRNGDAPYELVSGTLGECIQMLMTKPASRVILYEIHTLPRPRLALELRST